MQDEGRMNSPVIQTEAGHEGWDAIVSDPAAAVIASDFDGVLSPLVEDPARSRPVEGALDALARLANSVKQVAIVTARPRQGRRHPQPARVDRCQVDPVRR